jgi:hypothetical protein
MEAVSLPPFIEIGERAPVAHAYGLDGEGWDTYGRYVSPLGPSAPVLPGHRPRSRLQWTLLCSPSDFAFDRRLVFEAQGVNDDARSDIASTPVLAHQSSPVDPATPLAGASPGGLGLVPPQPRHPDPTVRLLGEGKFRH